MLNVVLKEQTYWKEQRKILRKNSKKLLISVEPRLYEKLEELALYNEELNEIASELVIEGLEYIYMEDIPVHEYHAFQHFVKIELSHFQQKLLQQLALKRGCSVRKMAYTVLHFMLKAQ
ncbi:hypothetical protein CN887_21070 [Bacillus pseudomycoides]|uniref:hypothetical protein n=1 Tax=Bacillus pseudomycoides TaxID=64104 RepID=UPI000BF189E6|nr:hypothetical protein [Bacillus pseudomycoides]PEJ23204.1 hypothetical protein CN887_21070 [Bacillus pseudomycoides]